MSPSCNKRLFFCRVVWVWKITTPFPQPAAGGTLCRNSYSMYRGPVGAEGFARTHVPSGYIYTHYNNILLQCHVALYILAARPSITSSAQCTNNNNMCSRRDWWPPPHNMHTDSWPWLIRTIYYYYCCIGITTLCAAHLLGSLAAYNIMYGHNVLLLCATGYTFWRSQ